MMQFGLLLSCDNVLNLIGSANSLAVEVTV